MSSVFRHLEKKWKVVVDQAYELSLLPSLHATALYQPKSDEVTIREFCQDESEMVIVYYRWESYSVDRNPLDFPGGNGFQKDVIVSDHAEEEFTMMKCEDFSPAQTLSNSLSDGSGDKEGRTGLEDPLFTSTNSFSDHANESILSSSTISTDSSISGFEVDCIPSDPFLSDISLFAL